MFFYIKISFWKHLICFSVMKLCLALYDPVDRSMPGFPILRCLLDLAQTHAHWVGGTIHLILCCPLLLLPSIFPSIRIFSNESALCIRWLKYWSFSFSISPSNEYSGLIFFRMDWFDLFAVQRSLKSLLQRHSLKASVFSAQPSSWSNFHIHTWLLENSANW